MYYNVVLVYIWDLFGISELAFQIYNWTYYELFQK